jgi:hypothetical protein
MLAITALQAQCFREQLSQHVLTLMQQMDAQLLLMQIRHHHWFCLKVNKDHMNAQLEDTV